MSLPFVLERRGCQFLCLTPVDLSSLLVQFLVEMHTNLVHKSVHFPFQEPLLLADCTVKHKM